MRSGLVCLADSQSCPLFCNPVDCMQHFSFPCLSPILRVFSYSCLSNQQCYQSISFSVVSFILPRSPSQHQGLFQEVSSLHQVAKVGSQMLSLKSFFSLSSFTFIKRLFSSLLSAIRVVLICISEVIDVSPGNLDRSLGFIQHGISHDILCMYVK